MTCKKEVIVSDIAKINRLVSLKLRVNYEKESLEYCLSKSNLYRSYMYIDILRAERLTH